MITLHLSFLAFSVAVILFADKQALSWMTGRQATLNAKTLHYTHLAMWVGLGGMIVTGAIMASSFLDSLIQQPYFILKMVFVGVLFVNGLAIGYLSPIASTKTFASLTLSEKIPLILSGSASFIGWIGAFVMAKLLFG